jgi:hypothetical protein
MKFYGEMTTEEKLREAIRGVMTTEWWIDQIKRGAPTEFPLSDFERVLAAQRAEADKLSLELCGQPVDPRPLCRGR